MKLKEKKIEQVESQIEIRSGEEIQIKKKARIIIMTLIFIIIFLVLLLYILCYRVGKIGYNYLSIWDSKISSIVIKAEDIEIDTKKEINIFKDAKIGNKNMIAPMSKGTFKFTIKNDTNEDAIYNIQFMDEKNSLVNMKYRLKMDNVYIAGSKEKYVDIDELDVKSLISPKDSTSIFTLEWFWENDDEKDIYVGTKGEKQYYGLTMHIYSQAYKK